jgi:hypothetical protein
MRKMSNEIMVKKKNTPRHAHQKYSDENGRGKRKRPIVKVKKVVNQ